jgi:hypothetical protein
VTADFGTVSGGLFNTSSGFAATVAGGYYNRSSNFATVGGGFVNVSSGDYSTVPGGIGNMAMGNYSTAMGVQAWASHDYSFVCSLREEFTEIRSPSFAVGRFHINAWNGLSIDYSQQRSDGAGSRWILIGATTGGQSISTWTGAWLSDGGTWINASDRNRKDGFADVNHREILEKVAALPIQSWHYTNEAPAIRHLGPVSQDFRAAFGLGSG